MNSEESEFDLSEFESITQPKSASKIDVDDAIDAARWYASSRLRVLGTGGSRRVYELSPDEVLKVARDAGSRAQNVHEASAWNVVGRPLARIVRASKSGVWLIAERAVPFRSEAEFASAVGWDADDFRDAIFEIANGDVRASEAGAFVAEAWRAIRDADLDIEDATEWRHWGTAADGSIVLIDAGLSARSGKIQF